MSRGFNDLDPGLAALLQGESGPKRSKWWIVRTRLVEPIKKRRTQERNDMIASGQMAVSILTFRAVLQEGKGLPSILASILRVTSTLQKHVDASVVQPFTVLTTSLRLSLAKGHKDYSVGTAAMDVMLFLVRAWKSGKKRWREKFVPGFIRCALAGMIHKDASVSSTALEVTRLLFEVSRVLCYKLTC